MMKPSIRSFLVPALALLLLGQGCSGSSQGSTGADGGVYKTSDRTVTWVQKRVLLKGPKAVSFGNDPITVLTADPQDHLAMYAGTSERGIVTSLNGGDSWEEITKGPKGSMIRALAVDPKDKCTVYATMRNKIYKTENCHRDWIEAYFDPKTEKIFTTIAVDWFNSTIVYAGTSEGDVFKSTDAGLSWSVIHRADARVESILFDPRDSRVVYIGTDGDGIWKTLDAGKTWLNIKNQLKDFTNAKRVSKLVIDRAEPATLYLVSKYGLLSSTDGGDSWTALKLTTEPNAVEITDFAVNPRNEKELAYVTKSAMVISSDKGATWNAKKLPSSRPATALWIDGEDGNVMYLGFGAIPK